MSNTNNFLKIGSMVLVRVPPGDRWREAGTENIHPSLTDALNAVFDKTGQVNYYIAARDGKVFITSDDEQPVSTPKPPSRFSIYGDD